ncbi:MAG: hypothetical protein HY900_30565 [Deltaproteobacteria bacterium]|nr:hypothetical protein [Deltaproteobacteria bacterium]
MAIEPTLGETFTYVLSTDGTMSAARFQGSSPDVFASPYLLGAVEAAAARLMERWLGPGEMSVGAGFELRHTAPTPLGWEVRTVATLVEWKGKKFVFAVECFDELEKIGEARHTRFIVEGAGFAAQVAAKLERREASR